MVPIIEFSFAVNFLCFVNFTFSKKMVFFSQLKFKTFVKLKKTENKEMIPINQIFLCEISHLPMDTWVPILKLLAIGLMSRRTNYVMNCVKAVSKHQEEITCQKE